MAGERRDGRVMGVYLPESLAQEGLEFVYQGQSSVCEKCPLYKHCVGRLKPGRRYKVVQIIKREERIGVISLPSSTCQLTNERVVSVFVESSEFEINIDKDRAIPEMSFRFDRESCTNYLCPQRPYCNYEGIKEGAKVEVVRIVEDKIDCPKGKPLRRVIIRIKGD